MPTSSTKPAKEVLVASGLFTWPDADPKLIGTHCRSCGDYFFPKTFTCPNPECEEKEIEEVALTGRGTIYSYTALYYLPPPPFVAAEPFEPMPIVQVEIPEGLRIIGLLEGCPSEEIRIGMDVALHIGRLYTDEEGNDIIGWQFRPVGGR